MRDEFTELTLASWAVQKWSHLRNQQRLTDYIYANYPRHLIRHQFYLTDEQFDAAISYTDAYYKEVESEYQIVVQQAEEIRDYWNERNKERIANISKLPPKPEYTSAWQKLQARKAKRAAISQ